MSRAAVTLGCCCRCGHCRQLVAAAEVAGRPKARPAPPTRARRPQQVGTNSAADRPAEVSTAASGSQHLAGGQKGGHSGTTATALLPCAPPSTTLNAAISCHVPMTKSQVYRNSPRAEALRPSSTQFAGTEGCQDTSEGPPQGYAYGPRKTKAAAVDQLRCPQTPARPSKLSNRRVEAGESSSRTRMRLGDDLTGGADDGQVKDVVAVQDQRVMTSTSA